MKTGQCGEQVFFHMQAGTLTIFGSGPMWDYDPKTLLSEQFMTVYNVPWRDLPVHSVVIESGVTRIGEGAFCRTSVQSAVLPETLSEIGDRAFSGSALQSIRFPDGVWSIGESAFCGCACLREVCLPDSVHIGAYGFACTGLERLTFRGQLALAGSTAFGMNSELTELKLPQSGFLGHDLFCSCGLRQADLSESGLQDLPASMFRSCKQLEKVILPPNLRTLGTASLTDTGLKELVLPETVRSFHPLDILNCDKLERIVFLGRKAPDCTPVWSFLQEELVLTIRQDAVGFDVPPWNGQPIERLSEEKLTK